MVADVFRRLALEMRHLAVQPLESLVEPPAERGRPAEAGLDHDHLQPGITLEHAFEHQACERCLLALRMADHFLDVEARPAGRGERIAAEAEGMDADRQADLLRRLVDRPIAALSERLDIAGEQQHLDEIFIAGALADFGGGGNAVFIGDDDRALQARILGCPFLDLPIIDRGADCAGQILVAQALPAGERIEHAEGYVVGIEQLLLHEGQRGALRAAFRRPGVAARGVRLRLRIGRAFHHAVIGLLAVGLEVFVPAFGEVGIEFVRGGTRRMDVAIGDRGLDVDG